MRLIDWSLALNNAQQHDYDSDDQQDVDQVTCIWEGKEANGPNDNQDNSNGIQ
jgi:hypothetical protein